MNGVALSAVDPSIRVLDIQPGEVKQTIRTNRVTGRPGARIEKAEVESVSVNVMFEIREYDTRKRQQICQKVQEWARSGTLTVSDRPNQKLRAVCEDFPTAGAKGWTDQLTIGFIGYNPPYWEETYRTVVEFDAAGSQSAFVPGNVPECLVSATVTAAAAITSITVGVNGKNIELTGLTVASGDKVYIGYDDNLILYIRHGSTSILDKRTAASVDDLKAECGKQNTFTVSASGNVTAKMYARGCWY